MSELTQTLPTSSLVAAVSRPEVFAARLLSSPCIADGSIELAAYFNASSAAAAFNASLAGASADWLVWVHQDVHLPADWKTQFETGLREALQRWPNTAVAGVYGVQGRGSDAAHAGRVLDRGEPLHPPAPLPCPADSLDELLVAVRTNSGLQMDPDLGFDFYGTDLVLQAHQAGLGAVIVDAYCEHWSDTPRQLPAPAGLSARIGRSAAHFERKWQAQLPVTTTCFHIDRPGAVQALLNGA